MHWLTGNRTDAEDVVQNACLRAFRGISKFSNGNPRAWVLTIVRHAAYDWLHTNRPAAIDLSRISKASRPHSPASKMSKRPRRR